MSEIFAELEFGSNQIIDASVETGNYKNVEWGKIRGTLSNQTDLQSALNAKASTSDIPTKTSQLQNDSGFLTEHQSLAAYRTSANQDIIDNALDGRLDVIEGKEAGWDAKQDAIADLSTIRSNASAGAAKVSCTEPTVAGFGFTKNTGTVSSLSDLGITATAAELNYTDGVTSGIQSQLDSKSSVSVSSTGTATEEVQYITVNGVEKKLAGGTSGVAWGSITGTLSDQSDLRTALNSKVNNAELNTNGYVIIDTLNGSTPTFDVTVGEPGASTDRTEQILLTDSYIVSTQNGDIGTGVACGNAMGDSNDIAALIYSNTGTSVTNQVLVDASGVTIDGSVLGTNDLVKIAAAATSGQVPVANGSGGYAWASIALDPSKIVVYDYANIGPSGKTFAQIVAETYTVNKVPVVYYSGTTRKVFMVGTWQQGAIAAIFFASPVCQDVSTGADTYATFMLNANDYKDSISFRSLQGKMTAGDNVEITPTNRINIYSSTASAGQVLTADGNSNATWESITVSKVSDLTATATELNYCDGVTSNIQTQLGTKANTTYVDQQDTALSGRITTNANDIDAIEAKIPAQATSSNQLADKDFVNSSITTNTATFRGTSAAGLTEAQFLAWANGRTKTNNDYVFWNTTDSAGNVVYKRYKYNGTTWVYEYSLNNSSFTAAQWSALNSGITDSKVSTYDGYASQIAGKQDTISFIMNPENAIDKINNKSLAAKYDSDANEIVSTYATKTELNGKQATLTTAQLNAANSGITSGKVSTYDGYASGKQDVISDLATIRSNASAGASKVSCTDATVGGFGYTKNAGTITGITMNGASKGTSGVVDLGTVITAHQDISGKENTSNKVTSLSASSTNTQYPSAKCVYDLVGNIESLLASI